MADGKLILGSDGKGLFNDSGYADICETCCACCPTNCSTCGTDVDRNATVTGFTAACCSCFNATIAITNTGTGCVWSGFFAAASPDFCGGEITLSCSSGNSGPDDELWTLALDLITLDQTETCSMNVQEYEGYLSACDSTTDTCGGGTYWMTVISADECEGSENVIKVVIANLP